MQPPVLLEDISTEGLSPDILVAGDIISKKYDFMMGDLDNNPYKIAQVWRSSFCYWSMTPSRVCR